MIRALTGLVVVAAIAACGPAPALSADGGFFATVFQSFIAPSATLGALLMTSPQGTNFITVSQPRAMDTTFAEYGIA